MDFKELLKKCKETNMSSTELIEVFSELSPVFESAKDKDKELVCKVMKHVHEKSVGPHFGELYAKEQVKEMFHTKRNGSICRGEIFSEDEAKTIYDKEVRRLGGENNVWDVYVAINAQFHDYSKLFKEWFDGDSDENLKCKIIESAIAFWFKDEDSEKGKVWNYFKDED